MRASAIFVLLAATGSAHARPRLGGGAWLHYEVHGLHAVDDTDAMTKSDDMVLAGARLHGFFGKTIAYHAGLALAAGSTIGRSGFAYDVALFPFGMALRLGSTSVVAIGTGIAASGAVGTLDDAVALPVELNLEAGAGPIRFLVRGRISYIGGADSRQSGAPSISFADELDATVGLRIGKAYNKFGFQSGNGVFVGASYREIAGAKFAGLVIGYSVDAASKPRGSDEW